MSRSKTIAPIVVIPVHAPTPTHDEIVSIRQCGKIFHNKEIAFLSPASLDLRTYFSIIPYASEFRVSRRWMNSISSYNRLRISLEFYKLFDSYTHILVHEPDAIVIRDELDNWCLQELDYIGAPFFEGFGFAQYKHDAYPIGVGNSGLSLIRTAAAQKVLRSETRWYHADRVPSDIFKALCGSRSALRRCLLGLGVAGELRGAWRLYQGNCDIFWGYTNCKPFGGHLVSQLCKEFRVGTVEQALRFSWGEVPRRCAELTNGALPLGFHGWSKNDRPWSKNDRNFLVSILQQQGVDFTLN
jgi:Protein of unknown function (DUF5672)